jgi:hypothetical protein
VHRSDELLELLPTDHVVGLIPLGLNHHDIQAESILVDSTVESFIANTADVFCGVLSGAAVAHSYQ